VRERCPCVRQAGVLPVCTSRITSEAVPVITIVESAADTEFTPADVPPPPVPPVI
jgi:hypothetical protein